MKTLYIFSIIVVLFASQTIISAKHNQEVLKYILKDAEGNYQGLTDHSKKLIEQSRIILRARKALFTKEFKQFDSVFHAYHVNRLIKGNMFFYGPPGGAKSKCIKWLFKKDNEKAFELQMHQMMNEQAFIGGQNFNAAKEGRFEVNTEGSLADFRVALIDEIDKGNPATLAALLSLLHERQILAGNKVIKSKLETVLSTSNANIYEIYEQFSQNGLRPTAAALLNRFTTIAFIPNWLSKKDQGYLDENYLESLDELLNPSQKENKEEVSLELNWHELRTLAYLILRPSEYFLSLSRGFNDMLRQETIKVLELQERTTYKKDTSEPYYPTADYTERLRQRLYDAIVMSVFIDLLTSPLTSDIHALENMLKNAKHNRLNIGPFSLWRAYLVLTTVSFGTTKLVFPTPKNGQTTLTIDFGDFFKSEEPHSWQYYPKDRREASTIEHLLEEQERFKTTFISALEEHQKLIKDSAYKDPLPFPKEQHIEHQDIERLLVFGWEKEDEI